MDQMKYPVAVVSKRRSETMQTSRELARLEITHFVVIEIQDLESYKRSLINFNIRKYVTLLVLPSSNHGDGPGVARNWFWNYAKDVLKVSRFWIMDDNIKSFLRFQNKKKIEISGQQLFRSCEDFVDRYQNIVMAGLQYSFFIVPGNSNYPPYVPNTRIYSCALIDIDCPFKFRGRYNEDTILSLDILKSGLCTVQFNHLLQFKAATQTVRGGNTSEFYKKEGTYLKSKMLVDTHKDVSRLAYKFRRIHHHVNYRPFKANQFIMN
jgi:hypothetical protein